MKLFKIVKLKTMYLIFNNKIKKESKEDFYFNMKNSIISFSNRLEQNN